jgi:hypothetical protein
VLDKLPPIHCFRLAAEEFAEERHFPIPLL